MQVNKFVETYNFINIISICVLKTYSRSTLAETNGQEQNMMVISMLR